MTAPVLVTLGRGSLIDVYRRLPSVSAAQSVLCLWTSVTQTTCRDDGSQVRDGDDVCTPDPPTLHYRTIEVQRH